MADISDSDKLELNKKSWDKVSEQFYGHKALPDWGPYGVGRDDPTLIGEIVGKTFLDIGCGSGHSINYLIEHGARKVYGLDMTHSQIEHATKLNKEAIDSGKVVISEGSMDDHIEIEPVDMVYSVYALGYSLDPDKLFSNVYSYLKPKGRFVWSWEHSFFMNIGVKDGEIVVHHSYFDEEVFLRKSGLKGEDVYLASRKISTWIQYLTTNHFDLLRFIEPKPIDLPEHLEDEKEEKSLLKIRKVPETMIFVCQKQ